MRTFDVYSPNGRPNRYVLIDTVFYAGHWLDDKGITCETVYRDLVEHDGHRADIIVTERDERPFSLYAKK